ncbi:MAG: hypothetical protein JSR48_14285 [Verrucomicrobia bacterium]|nr:hypothetical protein [Verrucomicrobiota bacterium]
MNPRHDLLRLDWSVVAETGERFGSFAPYVPSVSDDGVVAFQAARRAGGTGLYVGRDGVIAAVAEFAADTGTAFISHPDRNRRGELCAYVGAGETGRGLWFSDGHDARETAGPATGQSAIGPLGPTLNEAGAAALRAWRPDGAAVILVTRGDQVTGVAETDKTWSAFHGLPVINRDGLVAFRADRHDGTKAVCLHGPGGLQVVADTTGEFSDLANFPSLNDAGIVAFGARTRDGQWGVFVAQSGHQAAAVAATHRIESVRNALIDGRGRVIFAGTPKGGTLAIFGPAGADEPPLLAVGESRFGGVVAEFALNPVSLNASGDFAVRVRLADGRERIAAARLPD